MYKRQPIILFGTSFWEGLLEWFEKTLVEIGTISASDMDLFQLTDDPQFVVDTIFDFYEGVDLDQIIDESQLTMDL